MNEKTTKGVNQTNNNNEAIEMCQYVDVIECEESMLIKNYQKIFIIKLHKENSIKLNERQNMERHSSIKLLRLSRFVSIFTDIETNSSWSHNL